MKPVVSDRDLKAGFAPVEARQVLGQLAALPIESWSYKSEGPAVRHIGPMAQDFHAAFGLGEDDRHIDLVDANGVVMAAIQGVCELVQAQSERIAALQQQNAGLEERLAQLE